MDKEFFASVVARERREEISKDLAIRHMLEEANGNMLGTKKAGRLVLRFAPVLVVISVFWFFIIR